MKNTKNKLTSILAIVTVLCVMFGAFAYFTDRVDANATITTAKASDIIKVTPTDKDSDSENPGKALSDKWDAVVPEIVAPGDTVDLSYNLKNIGTSDIDVKETIILTSKQNLSNFADPVVPEWTIVGADGKAIPGVTYEIQGKQIKYTVPAFTLPKDTTDAKNVANLEYILKFDDYASNLFQGDVCTVDYIVELRQHVDGIGLDEQWDTLTTETGLTFNGKAVVAVPAA